MSPEVNEFAIDAKQNLPAKKGAPDVKIDLPEELEAMLSTMPKID